MKRYLVFFVSILFSIVFLGVSVNAQNNPPANEEKVYQRNEVDKPAQILQRPRAQTEGKCQRNSNGTVKLDIILRKTGVVEVLNMRQSSMCDTFDSNALRAARSIKFNPAVKDGVPVSVALLIEYNYSLY